MDNPLDDYLAHLGLRHRVDPRNLVAEVTAAAAAADAALSPEDIDALAEHLAKPVPEGDLLAEHDRLGPPLAPLARALARNHDGEPLDRFAVVRGVARRSPGESDLDLRARILTAALAEA